MTNYEAFKTRAVVQLWDFANFFIAFVLDSAKGGLILVGLIFFGWLLRLTRSSGIDNDHLALFEAAHFWLSFAAYGLIAIDFIKRLAEDLFFQQKGAR